MARQHLKQNRRKKAASIGGLFHFIPSVQCRLLAPNGPASRGDQRLFIGAKQTQCGHAVTSESDPKRILP